MPKTRDPSLHQATLTPVQRNALVTTMVTLTIVEGWIEQAAPQAVVTMELADGVRPIQLLPALAEIRRQWAALDLAGVLGLDRDD